MHSDQIYMDNAATTRVDPKALAEMLPFFSEKYGNASSPHSAGEEAKEAMDAARKRVAGLINASPDEIVFTSGGTESDNLALFGASQAKGKGHIITTAIEHPAVLNACEHLEKNGFIVTYVPVDSEGIVKLGELKRAFKPDTFLISIMHANNEIGTIQPIKEISKLAKANGALFHTDAVQTTGKIPIDVKDLGVDLLSVSSHKIHGPKGVGALYIRKGVQISPISSGGGHERGMRSGTENVSGIVGFGAAAKIAKESMEEMDRVKKMRDRLMNGLLMIEDTMLNGSQAKRIPNNLNISFKFIEGEGLLLLLDAEGIRVSTGSACSSKSLKPSHVLRALGRSAEDAHGSLRITLSKFNTAEEVDKVLEVIPRSVEKLRSISPFKSDAQIKEFSEKHATREEEEEHAHVH
ncbi:MAG: cysteine desulfurase NifS [Candidatus Micrarchaeota archaeon]